MKYEPYKDSKKIQKEEGSESTGIRVTTNQTWGAKGYIKEDPEKPLVKPVSTYPMSISSETINKNGSEIIKNQQ